MPLPDLKVLRRRMVQMAKAHSHGHLCGSLSALPIISTIYDNMEAEHDVFILSKGHAAPAWYAVLESLGYHPDVRLIHPERDPANGVTCTTGSLGHGLPIAVGVALAKQLTSAPGRVHVLLGDGECLEGTTWESLTLARRYHLQGRLMVHIDDNGWQGSCAHLDPGIHFKLEHIFPVHAYGIPKGYGVSLFEKHPEWHVHYLNDAEYEEALAELA
jgi:transketolase